MKRVDPKKDALIWDGTQEGFYEAYYIQCNDPVRGMGWWFRYSILIPKKGHGQPYAALWAIQYDQSGATGPVAMKHILPINHLRYQKDRFVLYLAESFLTSSHAMGSISHGDRSLKWDIQWVPSDTTFVHFPECVYNMPYPKSKVVSPNWASRGGGYIRWNDNEYFLSDALIHVGHVWGSAHSKRWAWAHSHGFDESQKVVFEGLWVPVVGSYGMSMNWLNIAREVIQFRNYGRLWQLEEFLTGKPWKFKGKSRGFNVDGTILVDPEHVAGVTYHDPGGGRKFCYNTKIATIKMNVLRKDNKDSFELNAPLASSFEVVLPYELPQFPILV